MGSQDIEKTPASRGGTRSTDLTTGSVLRHLIAFSIPMLLGSALHTAYSIINALWVGNGLGPEAMAAITVSFPMFFVLMAVAGGLTLAANILVAQAYGAKDWTRLKQVVSNSRTLTGAVSLACTGVGCLAAGPVLRAMQTPPDVLPMAISYLRVFLLTTPFMFGVFFLASVMRGLGDSKTPLYFQACSLILNAVLDPLLIFGRFGFPRLGLNGAAVATICAQAFALIAIATFVERKQHLAAAEWRFLRLDPATSLLTLKIGVPAMLQQALVSLGMLCVVSIVNRFGSHSAAAYGIAMRIDQVAFMPAMTIGTAVSTLAGQNIGANRYDRVGTVFRWGVLVNACLTLPGTLLAVAIPERLIGLFSHDTDVIAAGAHYLRTVGGGYMLFAVMFVANGVINGSGHTAATTVLSVIGFWAVRVPLAAYLAARLGRVEGVWYAVITSLAVGTLASFVYYCSGRWRRPVMRHGPPSPPQPLGDSA